MTKKRCKRKIYPLVSPLQLAMDGIIITPEERLDRLRIRELSSIDAMSKGKGTLQEWRELAELMNIAETLARNGVGIEALEVCAQVQAELIAVGKRFERTGSMTLTAQGLAAIRNLYELHDLQRTSITRADYERAIGDTMNRVKSRAGEVVDMAQLEDAL